MYAIAARNVNDALVNGLRALFTHGVKRESRNGPVLVFPTPVTTQYFYPCERVLRSPIRDANPFFHLFEALWMLAGRNDVAFPASIVDRMRTYSDDGKTLRGAYGFRWRNHFGYDQLDYIVDDLKKNPDSRRSFLSMWDAATDLGADTKDLPCNLGASFWIDLNGSLSMTVFCRSNDVLWGAYGANAVHFSVLLEYMASRIGVPVGRYWQVSNNFHLYLAHEEKARAIADENLDDPYLEGTYSVFPLVRNVQNWDVDLRATFALGSDGLGYAEPFFRRVVQPMMRVFGAFKDETRDLSKDQRKANALKAGQGAFPCDWTVAAHEWLERRRS